MPSILVADDNTNIQKMVSLAFEDRGITVVAVGNGEAAVRRIPDLNPDLVLADIFMPVRNGYEVCEFVKKDERFSHVPVILLVGAFDPLDEKEARRVGADGVLKKPFVPPDPLIAMVISALEKNPRVVAELAKAKASLEAQAAVESATSFEVETLPKPEPKPLPEFPEPTPEEAAIVYGFGKGIRALDDDEQTGASKEAPAPVAKRDEEDGEDLEGAATATDWRRNAMDFDIPDDQANRPAFSMMDDLESQSFFPSEAAPRKTEQKAEPAVALAQETRSSVAPDVLEEVDLRALEPMVVPPVVMPPPAVAPPVVTPRVEHAVLSFSEEPPAKEPDFAPPLHVESQPVALAPAPAPEREPEPEPAQEHEAKPSLVSRMRHWMDALVPSHSSEETDEETKNSGDWMAALSEPPAAGTAAVEQKPVEPAETAPLAIAKREDENFFAVEAAAPPEPATSEFAHLEAMSAEMDAPEPDAAFLDANPYEHPPAVPEMTAEPEASETPAVPFMAQAPEPSRLALPEPSPEIWERDEESTPSVRDPELVVPEAVHVTPEPLLVEEAPEAQSSYFAAHEEVPAAHAFEVPLSPEPVSETSDASAEEEPLASEPTFEFAAEESAAIRTEERIPTGPPPNREALAEIPFLNPPRDFDPNAQPAPAPAAVDPSTVDAVVQKVLEKLQPQLHDLLSQGVLKPLVENLLQQESKKEK